MKFISDYFIKSLPRANVSNLVPSVYSGLEIFMVIVDRFGSRLTVGTDTEMRVRVMVLIVASLMASIVMFAELSPCEILTSSVVDLFERVYWTVIADAAA